MNDCISELEDRILDLEFKQLKKKLGWERILVTTKRTPENKSGFSMRMSTGSNGEKKYELRSGSGWTTLPTNRALWPIEAREIQDKVDAYDKQRRVEGRMVSVTSDFVRLVG